MMTIPASFPPWLSNAAAARISLAAIKVRNNNKIVKIISFCRFVAMAAL
jgi:hypothetical protein